jgi:nitroreductase
MEFIELVKKTRSYRRFKQDEILRDTLLEFVEAARLAPSSANLQPLKYFISNDSATNEKIFPNTAWAGYLADWPGPAEGERPTAYIIIMLDKELAKSPNCDHGIVAQNIVLAAAEKGIGACMIGSLKRDNLRKAIELPERYDILLAVALGVPAETVVLEDIEKDGSIKYYRDESGTHHSPKRKLEDIVL